MPKTQVESITDEIWERVAGSLPPYPAAKNGLELVVRDMLKAGFQIIPPGAKLIGERENVAIDHTSFFCPNCGKHKPRYGFIGAHGDVKGFGAVTYLTIFCGEDNCRRILQVLVLGMTPEGSIGHG